MNRRSNVFRFRARAVLALVGVVGLLGLAQGKARAAGFVYVTNDVTQVVSVIDVSDNSVVEVFSAGVRPTFLVATPDDRRIYLSNLDPGDGTVTVIDTHTNAVVDTIGGIGFYSDGLDITGDGTRVYVADRERSVRVIDTATNTITETIDTGPDSEPRDVAITPSGKAFIPLYQESELVVLDTATNTVQNLIIVPGPTEVTITPNGTQAWVSSLIDDVVSVVDANSETVVAEIDSCEAPAGIDHLPDSSRAYIACLDSDEVLIVDRSTFAVVDSVATPSPVDVVITPDGSRAYVSNKFGGNNSVTVIDTATGEIMTTISPVGPPDSQPFRMVYVDLDRRDVPASSTVGLVALALIVLSAGAWTLLRRFGVSE